MSFAFVFIQLPTLSCCMQTKGTNGARRAIVGYVVGGSHSVRSRVIAIGLAVAVAVVIAVAKIPTTVGIFCSSTFCASSVDIGTNFL